MTGAAPALQAAHCGSLLRPGRPLRMAFVTQMPSPYMQDLFAAMADDGRISPSVHYLEMAAPDTYWGAVPLPPYAALVPGRSMPFWGGRIHVNFGLLQALRKAAPDVVVVGGYASLANQAAMLWLTLRRTPWVFFGELPGLRQTGPAATLLRQLAQRPAVRWPSAIAAVGSRAEAAYRALAGPRQVIANIPYFCRLDPFLKLHRAPLQPHRPLRLLYCGQLIHRKGLDLLVRSFVELAQQFPGLELTLVGSGPLERTLQDQIPSQLRQQVNWAGFRRVDELPAVFAAHDLFVLPSRHDGWGVVVNQAIAAGLPVVASDAVGAAHDLIRPRENGLLFPAGDQAALTRVLYSLLESPQRLVESGEASRRLAQEWTPAAGVERWYRLLRGVVDRRSGRGDGWTSLPQAPLR